MKRTLIMCVACAAALVLAGCKSKESSYKKAYEKAKAQEMAEQTQNETVQVTPVVAPVETPVVEAQESDTQGLRQERLNVVGGGSLKTYNVVCGSFKSQDNANNLCQQLTDKGYSAQVAQNPETGMYRVIASSFDDKASAISSRNALRASYPDAWLLCRTY